jgi:ABC-type polysaccharide/polyol phosphate transport system ATPase subunit
MLRSGTIVADRIWKRFRPEQSRMLLRDQLQSFRHRIGRRDRAWMWALRDISVALESGDSLGLMGPNGSGKSTLLKILTRVMYPYAGRVDVSGRVGALIEVTSGLHPDLTGRENAFLVGSLLGLSRKDVAQRFDDIIAFAELEAAVDRQVKFYSSGMKMRLGFAVSAFLEPDILIVDEVLAVGDASFQTRCLERMRDVLAQGTTLIYVSHDLPTIEATCARSIWLSHGEVQSDGPTPAVLVDYRRSLEEGAVLQRRNDGPVRVLEVNVDGEGGRAPQTNEALEVMIILEAKEAKSGPLFLGVTEGPGTPVLTFSHDLILEEGKTSVRLRVADLPLPRGRFYLWMGMFSGRGRRHTYLPWGPVAHFDVAGPSLGPTPQGIVRLAPVYAYASWDVDRPPAPGA